MARVVQIYPRVSQDTAAYCPLQVGGGDTARTVIRNAVVTLGLDASMKYSLLEVRKSRGEERLLEAEDCLLERVLLWPPETQRWHLQKHGYYFILQQASDGGNQVESSREDYDDLCSLQTVTEQSVLEALRQRFYKLKIYTYASSILIAINPNKLLPVYYNPKYVKMYENQPLGKLSPHIFAIADVAFRAMLSRQVNQCIVISGESGSGKTESSSYLIHCLTALSQKTYSTGLERTILGAGPVLEVGHCDVKLGTLLKPQTLSVVAAHTVNFVEAVRVRGEFVTFVVSGKTFSGSRYSNIIANRISLGFLTVGWTRQAM